MKKKPRRERATVQRIARDRRATMRELNARLMEPTGLQSELDERAIANRLNDAHLRDRLFRPARPRGYDA
jgi:hypothetical protein